MNNLKNNMISVGHRAVSGNTARLVKGVIDGSINLPDDAIVFDTKDDFVFEIFTRKRQELLKIIIMKKPLSVGKLANLVQRKIQAVDRDLRLLARYELVKLEKKGKIVTPSIGRPAIFMPSLTAV